jgi:predicted nucleic acid-binding protein
LIVVDASAVIEVLLNTPRAQSVADRILAPGQTLHVPHLLDLEVAQVLRRYALAGDIDGQRGSQAIADMNDLLLNRYSHDFLLPRIWALRNNATAYDAAYIALAEALGVPLVTCDRALAEVPGVSAEIEVIG